MVTLEHAGLQFLFHFSWFSHNYSSVSETKRPSLLKRTLTVSV